MHSFGQILDVALDENVQRQMIVNHNKTFLSPHQWLREFGTIAINYGRQTGKTTAILKRATSNDLVVCHSMAHVNYLKSGAFWKPTFTSVKSLENDRLKGKRFDRIWVDDASYMTKTDLDNVYIAALIHHAEQIILIG